MPDTINTYDGTEVEVDVIQPLEGGGARVEVDQVDGPRWRVDVTRSGTLSEKVTTWNSDDELADMAVPEWMDGILLRLARA